MVDVAAPARRDIRVPSVDILSQAKLTSLDQVKR
jgi:hypothetical protein